MQTCRTCSKDESQVVFRDRGSHAKQDQCVGCRAAYNRRHYLRNKEDYKKRAKAQRLRNVQRVADLKAGACMDCEGKFHHAAMQFDHARGSKVKDISKMVRRSSWAAVLREIKKCDLVCANCHAVRTWTRIHGGS